MSENPYFRAMWLEKAAFRFEVPLMEVVRAAYEADEIDIEEFERLVEAALTATPVDLSPALRARMYQQRQNQVRFTDCTTVPTRGHGLSL